MKKMTLIILLCASFVMAFSNGKLVIIGGGKRTTEITNQIIKFAGGTEAKIIVIPMASSEPLESAISSCREFQKAGCKNVDFIICDVKSADSDTSLRKLDGVKGVYFTGGDQNLLTKALLGTKFLEKIRNIHKAGGVISGTSAGAAVMSKMMITGDERINKDSSNAFNIIHEGNIITAEGFGFMEKEIIDQHFIKRKRHNRLINLVLENPKLMGIGIDESTAIAVHGSKYFEVIGESSVMIFNAEGSKISVNSKKHLTVDEIKMSILNSGDKFDLKKRKIIK